MENSTMKLSSISEGLIKITDSDLDSFWDHMSSFYALSFNIEGQNLTDKVSLHLRRRFSNSENCMRQEGALSKSSNSPATTE